MVQNKQFMISIEIQESSPDINMIINHLLKLVTVGSQPHNLKHLYIYTHSK